MWLHILKKLEIKWRKIHSLTALKILTLKNWMNKLIYKV